MMASISSLSFFPRTLFVKLFAKQNFGEALTSQSTSPHVSSLLPSLVSSMMSVHIAILPGTLPRIIALPSAAATRHVVAVMRAPLAALLVRPSPLLGTANGSCQWHWHHLARRMALGLALRLLPVGVQESTE